MKGKIVCYFIIAMLVISCNDKFENLAPKTSNDFLSFNSPENMKIVIDKLAGMNSNNELTKWENENGGSFVSMRTVLSHAYEEFNLVTSEEEQNILLKKYGDILTLRDSTITPFIGNTLIQSYINREGIYKVEDRFNKIVGNFIASVKEKDFQKLNSLKISDNSLTKTEGVEFTRYRADSMGENGRVKEACAPYMKNEYTYDPSGCKNDRRAQLQADVGLILNSWYEYRLRIQITAMKKNLVCNWVAFDSPVEMNAGTYSVSASTWGNIQLGFSGVVPYSTGSYSITHTEQVAAPWGQNSYPINFTAINVSGKSQGVGLNWAVITCP